MTEQTTFVGPESVTEGDSSPTGRVERLEAIIARLTALTEPSREVDAMICRDVLGWGSYRHSKFHWIRPGGTALPAPAFTASLDAILSHLLPEGWGWTASDHDIDRSFRGGFAEVSAPERGGRFEQAFIDGSTPAIALAIACIRARMEDE